MRRRETNSPGGTAEVYPSGGKSELAGIKFLLVIVLSLPVLGAPLQALAQTDKLTEQASDPRDPICLMIESAARANTLPVDFFARMIWQESRFRPDVIGPVTHSGERAQGVAQFMPGTAAERRLFEPFNPMQALPKSGEFIAELRNKFGNLGLAAAAYNAGPRRVREFIGGSRGLPLETRNYVLAITGRSIEDWAKAAKDNSNEEKNGDLRVDLATVSCRDLIPILKQSHAPFLADLPQRSVPGWCRHLRRPNINVCGSAHDEERTIETTASAKSRGHAAALRASLRESDRH